MLHAVAPCQAVRPGELNLPLPLYEPLLPTLCQLPLVCCPAGSPWALCWAARLGLSAIDGNALPA